MTTLVTGIAGFIGYSVAKQLREHDKKLEIKGLILPSEKNKIEHLEELDIDFFIGDLTQKHSIKEATRNIDTVFHLAAEVEDTASLKRFNEVNHQGTLNLINSFSEDGGQKFIYISTAGIYGLNLPKTPISEDYRKNPLPGYRSSKYAGEVELFRQAKKKNFFASVIRPPITFGPRDKHFSPKLFDLILEGKRIPLFSKGKAILPLCYVDDVAYALIAASKTPEANGEAFIQVSYHVTQKELFNTIGEVCSIKPNYLKISYSLGMALGLIDESISKLVDKEPLLTRHRVKQLGRTRLFDMSKAEKILKVQAKLSFKEAIKRTYES
ncbi:MAG: NAD-dependent epimerase/dehydratase family protein [Candidatus Heimdallarchaeaceae archaeon]